MNCSPLAAQRGHAAYLASVTRYLESSHPDQLIESLQRTEGGFAPIGYEEALDRVAAEMQRIQAAYGKDALAVVSASSLATEKTYLVQLR